MLTVLAGLAEFERELIRARTGEGRKRAKDGLSAHYGTVVPRGAYRGSFVRRFNCTVASTASMRSPPAAMA